MARDADLRRWRGRFTDAVPIADLVARRRGTCVGVVKAIRLVPAKALEVTVEDGTGELTATWVGRSRLPGLELGAGLRLEGTVAGDFESGRRMLNPAWTSIVEPHR